METKLIRVSEEVYERLKMLRRQGETFDGVIWDLLEKLVEKKRRK